MKRTLLGSLISATLPAAYAGAYIRGPVSYAAASRETPSEPLLEPQMAASLHATPLAQLKAGTEHEVRELLFVDASVDDRHALYKNLKPGVQIVELSSQHNGLAQILRSLRNHRGLAAVHIVSHARQGELMLGNAVLGHSSVSTDSALAEALRSAVNPGGDVLLYGCDLAQGAAGRRFVETLAQSSGLNVAASNDTTGAASLGGDWNLEIVSGTLDTKLPFSPKALSGFTGILPYSGTIDFDPGDVSIAGSYAGGTNAVNAEVTVGAYTLVLDGDSFSTGAAYGYGLASNGESAVTLRFSNNESFSATSIWLQNANGSNNDTFTLTGNLGGSTQVTLNGNTTEFTTVDLSGFPANMTSLTITVQDGSGSFLFDNFIVTNVAAAGNNAPSVSNAPADVTVVEDSSSDLDLSSTTVADADGDNLTVTLAVSAGTMSASSGGGVTVGGSGTSNLTLSGSAANINTYLDTASNIQYTGAANINGNDAATLTLTPNDGTEDGTAANINIDITAVNDEPTLSATGTNPTFTEGGAVVGLFSGASASSVESGQTITGMTLTVTNLSDGSAERLHVDGSTVALTNGNTGTTATNSLSYSVALSSGTATVTLSGGTLSAAAVQTMVNSLSYSNTSDDPAANRVVTLTSISDSGSNTGANDNVASLAITSTVTLSSIDDEPTLSATGTNPTFTEGGAVVGLFSGASASTVESGQTITGMNLTVTNLSDGSSEQLNVDGSTVALTNGNSGTTATNSLSYSVAISGSTATLTLSGGTLSAAATQTLVNSLAYSNTSNDPSAGSNRVVTLTSITDSGSNSGANDNLASLAIASTVSLAAVNDEPTLSATGANATFTEDGAAVSLFSGASVSTVESGQTLSGLTLTVTNLADGTDEILSVDGSAIALTHGTNGTSATNEMNYSVNVSGSTATLTLSGGILSSAAMQTLVNGITYHNASEAPQTSNRVVTITSMSDNGSNSGANDNIASLAVSSTIAISSVNDAPSLRQLGNLLLTEGDGAVFLDTDVAFADPDGGFDTATLVVSNLLAEDVIAIAHQGTGAGQIGISGSNVTYAGTSIGTFTGGTGTNLSVTFNANATAAAVEALIESLTYENTSDEPTFNRTLSMVFTDTESATNPATFAWVQSTASDNPMNGFSFNGYTRAAIADLDDDGDLDIIAGSNAGTFAYYRNDGTASAPAFVEHTVSASNPLNGYDIGSFAAPELADIDGDGDYDLIVGDVNASVFYLRNDGSASTPVFTSISGAENPLNAVGAGTYGSPALVDIDGDGDLDAVVGIANDLQLFENTGSTTSPVFNLITDGNDPFNGFTFSGYSAPTFGDFDNDGDYDMLVGTSDGGINFYLNQGDASTAVFALQSGGNNPFNGWDVGSLARPSVGDLDGDGDLDILIGGSVGDFKHFEHVGEQNSLAVRVRPTNDAPTLTATGANPSTSEGDGASNLFSGASAGVVESGDAFTGLTLSITNVREGASEFVTVDGTAIALADSNSGSSADSGFSYSVSVSATTATISLTGSTLAAADFQTMIEAISYQNTSEDPGSADRVITITSVTDSGGSVNGGTDTTATSISATVSITPIDDAPELSATATNPTFTEDASAASLFSAASASTVEADQTFTGLSLTVTNVADGTSEILGLDGSAIALTEGASGVTVNNNLLYAVSTSGSSATVTVSGGSMTPSQLQTLIDGLTYANTDNDPTMGSERTVTLNSVTDSGDNTGANENQASLALDSTITLAATNDAPMLTATGTNPTFTESGVGVVLFNSTAASTVESGQNFTGFTLTVTNVSGTGDELLLVDNEVIPLTHGANGKTNQAFDYAVVIAGATATVTFSNAAISAVQLQNVINAMQYTHTGDDPTSSGASRLVTITGVSDNGDSGGANANLATLAVSSNVSISARNDAPTLSANSTDPSFSEGGTAVSLFSGSAASTIEAGQSFTGLSLSVTNLADGANESLLIDGSTVALSNGNSAITQTNSLNYTVALTGTTATVTLTGTLSGTALQTLVDDLQYHNGSANPSGSARSITVNALTDNGGSANGGSDSAALSLTSTVALSAVNDDPVASGIPVEVTVVEDTASELNLSSVTLSDPDAGDAAITLSLQASAGTLTAANADGVSVSGSATDTVTLSATLAELNSYLDNTSLLHYTGAANANGNDAATLALGVNDNGNTGTGGGNYVDLGTVSVDITPVDDPAVVSGTFAAGVTEGDVGDTANAGGVLSISDVDTGENPEFADRGETAGDNGYGSFTLTAGNWVYTLDQNSVQALDAGDTVVDTISFSASDDTIQQITITITGSNDAPTISGVPATSVDEDTSYSFVPSATDVDASASLTYSIDNPPSWASFDSSTGALSGKPSNDDVGITSGIVISVSDGSTNAALPSFSVSVNNTNDAPSDITLSATSVTQGAGTNGLVGELSTIDVDAGDSFSYALVDGTGDTDNASFNINGNRLRVNDASALDAGNYRVRVQTDDGSAAFEKAFTVTVVDDLAAAVTGLDLPADGHYGIGAALNFTLHFSEAISVETTNGVPRIEIGLDGESVMATYSGGSGSEHLQFQYVIIEGDVAASGISLGANIDLNGGTLIDGADNNANTSLASVTSTNDVIVDGVVPSLAEATAVATPTNNANPEVVINVSESGTWRYVGNCDIRSESQTAETGDNTLVLTAPNEIFAMLAEGLYEGCTLRLADAAGNLSEPLVLSPFTVDTTAPTMSTNLPLIAAEGARVVIENLVLAASDAVSTPTALTYQLQSLPSAGTLLLDDKVLELEDNFTQGDIDDGLLAYQHDGSENMDGDFSFTVQDEAGNSAEFRFEIAHLWVNDAPVIAEGASVPVTISEDADPNAFGLVLHASDVDLPGDTLSWSLASAAANGLAAVNGTGASAVVTYQPAANFTGNDSFVVEVSDGTDKTSVRIDVVVASVNDAPTISGTPAEFVAEDSVYVFVPTGMDVDANTALQYRIVNQPDWASFDPATGTLAGTPDNSDVGTTESIVISVSDGELSAALPAFDLSVRNVNDAPVITGAPTTSVAEDSAYAFTPSASDIDADTNLTFAIANKPAWANFDTSTGQLHGTPGNEHVGTTADVVINVSDGELSAALPAFSVSVTNVNDAPEISGTPATAVDQDSAYLFTPQAQDIDVGDNLSFTITNKPGWASFDPVTGSLSGTPGNAEVGGYPGIAISVSDGTTTASLPSFDLSVNDLNDAPEIHGEPATRVIAGEIYSFAPSASDVDAGDELTFSINAVPAWASFDPATGLLTGQPGAGDIGSVTVAISVSDGELSAHLPSFSLSVVDGVDSDGDGISDAQEALDGTDPNDAEDYFDEVAPDVVAPEGITIDATALFTPVGLRTLMGLADDADEETLRGALNDLATDNIQVGECCDTLPAGLVDDRLLLAPGRHEIMWIAIDRKGNIGDAIQIVNVRPLVSMSKDQLSAEGAQTTVKIVLNGPAPHYPFTVPYLIDSSSTASLADHDLRDGQVSFTKVDGKGQTEALIRINLSQDEITEGEETLVLRLDDRTAEDEDLANGYDPANPDIHDINAGAKNALRLRIVEDNVAPALRLQLRQGGSNTVQVTADGGPVTVTAEVTDANSGDTFTYDWSASDASLTDIDISGSDSTHVFDPAELAAGRYKVALTVTDAGGLAVMRKLFFRVVSELPVLVDTDTDGDGLLDSEEGTADSDDDGIPDYLDNIQVTNVLPEVARETDSYLVECDPGLRCALGQYALLGEQGGVRLSSDDIAESDEIISDQAFEHVGGVFDFIISELPTSGQSVSIVLPLTAAIPQDGVYRKFQNGTWTMFVEDANNTLHSTAGSAGYCPPPGDPAWQAGLSNGHLCLQLTIEDGGPNDADGLVNGEVEDPGAIAVALPAEPQPPGADRIRSRSKGGSVDWQWLIGAALLSLMRRARRPQHTGKALVVLLGFGLCLAHTPSVSAETSGWQNALQNSYVQTSIYQARGTQSQGKLARELSDHASDIEILTFDTNRFAVRFGAGVAFNEVHALEASYLYLGEVKVNIDAVVEDSEGFTEALQENYPISAGGIDLSYRYSYQLNAQFDLSAKIGLYFWNGEIELRGSQINPDLGDGVDPLIAFQLNHELLPFATLSLEMGRIFFDEQAVDLFGLNFRRYFR